MCQLLTEETSGWLQVSEVEPDAGGRRGRTSGPSLTHLVAAHPGTQFSLVIGSDILKDLPHWKDFDRVRSLAEVLVLHRAGYPAPEASGPALIEVSSTDVPREELTSRPAVVDLVPRTGAGVRAPVCPVFVRVTQGLDVPLDQGDRGGGQPSGRHSKASPNR